MEAFKSIITSKTIIAAAVTLVANVIAVWGIDMSQENQSLAVTLITAIGAALVGAFRTQATTQLVASSTVAQVANDVVAQGEPPKRALKAAKRVVAERKSNRA